MVHQILQVLKEVVCHKVGLVAPFVGLSTQDLDLNFGPLEKTSVAVHGL